MNRIKILLVEDDIDDRIFFETFLNNRSDIILMKPIDSGVALIEKLQREHSILPDLIILDQNMPVLTGIETLMQLQNNEALFQIPVIIYSTYVNNDIKEEGIRLGAINVVEKPNEQIGYNKLIDDFIKTKQIVDQKLTILE